MMYLEKNQERYAFLGGVVTSKMKKTKKGSVKVKILEVYHKKGFAKVKILKNGVVCSIETSGIIPFKPEIEEGLRLEALKRKFNK